MTVLFLLAGIAVCVALIIAGGFIFNEMNHSSSADKWLAEQRRKGGYGA